MSERDHLRQVFFTTWEKHQTKAVLEPLEAQLLEIILIHPEYHAFLSNPENLHKDFGPDSPEGNPFLHMAMHQTIREQIQTDRPTGVSAIYNQLILKHSPHDTEHKMQDILGEILWQAQTSGSTPNEQDYLDRLKALI